MYNYVYKIPLQKKQRAIANLQENFNCDFICVRMLIRLHVQPAVQQTAAWCTLTHRPPLTLSYKTRSVSSGHDCQVPAPYHVSEVALRRAWLVLALVSIIR